ncbi:MAG: DUF1464 family protein [Candidatus Altarchaeum sp.]|nr:DUF1464 family protein [Candidatus Altarchaeum sp.]
MKAIGIDAGTSKWAISVLEEYKEKGKTKAKFKFETTIPTKEIKSDVNVFINLIENFNADCIVLPSGYGLPLKHISELSDDDLFKISFKNKDEKESIGIRKFSDEIKKRNLNSYVIPSVKHLPTVEDFKKVNVIDLGTSDKLCSAVYALSLSKNFKAENFILAEIGYGFNAFVKVRNGKICDGIGGTISSSGFLAHGRTDSEINQNADKFSGGVLNIIKQKVAPEEFFKNYKKFENGNLAYNYFIGGIIKDISALLDSKISKIYLCGKISCFVEGEIKRGLERKFERIFVTKNIEKNVKGANGSSASRGAAIIANGINGGKFKNLTDRTKIKDAKGDIFDYVFI